MRLLTLTGPGGIGKTRFAIELAHTLGPEFAEGARFVALGALERPEQVGAELEAALGDISDRELLLVVDNFEQLLDAATEIARVLDASPRTKVVVTSRAPLRLGAEHELALGALAREPATALFIRRARAVDPRLKLDGAPEVAQICAKLDGLPLAIELAAARIRVLAPAEILERLSRRLDLLSSGPRDAPARQQTLRAAIGWSYDLLDAESRVLFSRLSVFAGGFTVTVAEEVCGPDALDGIQALADQSLLTRDQNRRFGMLETVREYALERLEDGDAVRDRHARAFAAQLEGTRERLEGAELPEWLARLDADHDNIRAALRHATARGDAATALALVAPMWRYWVMRGNVAEGRALATAALALPGGPPALRMTAVNGAGVLAGEQGDFDAARAYFEESLELARESGSRGDETRASSNLGVLAVYAGAVEDAIRRYEYATTIARETGDERTLGLLLQNLGLAHAGVGNRERAVALLEEGIAIARRTQNPALVASIQRGLARVLIDADSERARALLAESLGDSHALADAHAIVFCLETAAALAADPATGAKLWGAADAMRAASGAARQPDEAAFAERVEGTLRDAVGPAAFTSAVAEGAALSQADAVALALEPKREIRGQAP